MQLLALVLYHQDGRTRRLDFRPGALNVVTGQSETGKSALLTIIDYCLGRDSMRVPVGIISRTVAWYGSLWELDGTGGGAMRAFVGRPKPAEGRQSTSVAMVEFGVGLEPPAFEELRANSDTTQLRQQLGRNIGIEESALERSWGHSPAGFEANLAHAALLCLQTQSEVANQAFMFHRQAETGLEQALRDTIPFFLGAIPRDQARKRALLREARRTLARLQDRWEKANLDAGSIDVELQALLAEAHSVGLIPGPVPADDGAARDAGVEPLTRAVLIRTLSDARSSPPPTVRVDEVEVQNRVENLDVERERLNRELRETLDERALLLRESRATNEVAAALDQQRGRLTSLGLIEATAILQRPDQSGTAGAGDQPSEESPALDRKPASSASASDDGAFSGDLPSAEASVAMPDVQDGRSTTAMPAALYASDCPVCHSQMAEPDATAAALQRGLSTLTRQLQTVSTARPANRRALEALDERADRLREQLRAADTAIANLTRADTLARETALSARDFTRGRIDAILARANVVDTFMVEALADQVRVAREQVLILEGELVEYTSEQGELNARLQVVGSLISEYAAALELEHSGGTVVLDLPQLTVLAETAEGTAPLSRIGSAKNWVGYHLATHLALHNFFITRDRPVPRFLILDQPTQAHYPTDADDESGQPRTDADRVAVRRMFRVMYDFVNAFAPRFQIIVCDHADLPEQWFSDSVRYRWREGRSEIPALIPADWEIDTTGSDPR